MDHVKATVNFLKRIAFGKIEDGQSWETYMMLNMMKPFPKFKEGENPGLDVEVQTTFWEDEVFSPYELIKDFDVRTFLNARVLEAAETYRNIRGAEEAYLQGFEEIKKIPDDKLFKYFVDNYFHSEKDFYKFVIEHAGKKTKEPPSWWFYIENQLFDREVNHVSFRSIMEPE